MNNTHQNEPEQILYHLHEAIKILEKPAHIMTKEATASYEKYIQMGWTDAQLIKHELMLDNEPILGFLSIAENVLDEMASRLDTSNPPQGGSGVIVRDEDINHE